MLERPLNRIEALRQQRGLPIAPAGDEREEVDLQEEEPTESDQTLV